MNKQNTELKNGLELLLLLDLTLATMDDYNLKGPVKNKANLFRNALEKQVNNSVDDLMGNDEEFFQNASKRKERMIKQLANLNEADNLLISEFINKFIENIDIARKKGIVFFDKLL
jgi:hypothetical protein